MTQRLLRTPAAAAVLLMFVMTMAGGPARAASKFAKTAPPTRTIVYKKVGDVVLKLHVFEPAGHQASDHTPAIVFFFGGGWVGGSPQQFYPQCAYLAKRGMWAASAEYRVKSRNHTTPIECVKDGKSAIRYVRAHAKELGIDPGRIAAGGGSAGGHVAAATATVTAFNEDTDDLSVSAVPDALVLFNAVYDNGPGGWGHKTVEDYWQKISPMANIHKGIPPAVVFKGHDDALIPDATAEKFQKLMQAVGSRSDLHLYDHAGHGFFNKEPFLHETMTTMDDFLVSIGYLKPKSEPKQ